MIAVTSCRSGLESRGYADDSVAHKSEWKSSPALDIPY